MRTPAATSASLFLAATVLAAGVAAAQDVATPSYYQRLMLPTRSDQIGYPGSVVADLHTGEVFVPDIRNRRIDIFDARGMFLYQINGGEQFSGPSDLAVDPDGYILLAARFSEKAGMAWLDFDGRFIKEVVLSGEGVEDAEPQQLHSVALSPDGGRIFALDQTHLTLWIADRDGQVLKSVSMVDDSESTKASEILLGHMDVYGNRVLVAMPTAGKIRVYDLEGAQLYSVGRKGTAGCRTGFPMAAALDQNGNLIVIDQQRAIGMIWNMETNQCLQEFSGIGRAPGAFYQPSDIALDCRGYVYVSQGFEGRVQVFKGFAPAAATP